MYNRGSWSYSKERAEEVRNAIEWTDERLEILEKEASKPLFSIDHNRLSIYAIEWGCIYDTINLKIQEIRASKFNGDYLAYRNNEMEKYRLKKQ